MFYALQDRVSARIAKNGVRTRKIWLKEDSRDLFAKDMNFQGLAMKKPVAKT